MIGLAVCSSNTVSFSTRAAEASRPLCAVVDMAAYTTTERDLSY